MNVLGLKINSHDTGAALIADERIIAVSEERLCRDKHSFNIFPQLSINYCLQEFGLTPKDINLVVIDQVDLRSTWPMKEWFLEKVKGDYSQARIEVINHQDAHAASAFFASPYEEAAVLVYDGSGERFKTRFGVMATESETLYRGRGNTLLQLQKTLHAQERKDFPYTIGIGKLYQRISEKYLDFGKYNEGKMMGLAPYGTDVFLKEFPFERWCHEDGGHIVCNAQITYPERSIGARLRKFSSPHATLQALGVRVRVRSRVLLRSISKRLGAPFYGSLHQAPDLFDQIRLPRPARTKENALPDEYYSSVAFAIQKILEEVAVRWGMRLKELTGLSNLCVAGGVGLNIDANRNFLDRVGFKSLFVQPAASDAGIPLGCALWGWHMILGNPRFFVMKSAALGRNYSEKDILEALKEYEGEVTYRRTERVAHDAAALIADGKIIGWHQGGSEYGPRALGQRSMLCDARGKDMKDVMNNRVKHRESWRPFAASILREKLSEWFELETESPATAFMLLAAPVREEKRASVPSVVHVDGTCRMQTLTKEANDVYYDLVKEFEKQTGVPLILNTSFNLGGEPIVETPKDSLRCFLSTDMDYLVIGDYIVSRLKG